MSYSEILKKYFIEKITRYSMDYDDFDDLVRAHLPKLTGQATRYTNFECVAEFEWNNDSNYDAGISESNIKNNDFYDKYDKKEILAGKHNLGLHQVLCFLADNKIIPFGNYEIRVSW